MTAWKVLSGRALANLETPPEIAYTGLICEPPLSGNGRIVMENEGDGGRSIGFAMTVKNDNCLKAMKFKKMVASMVT